MLKLLQQQNNFSRDCEKILSAISTCNIMEIKSAIVGLELVFSETEKKEIVYAAIRSNDTGIIKLIFNIPSIREYIAKLYTENPDHMHILRLLETKIDLKMKKFVCELLEVLALENKIPETIISFTPIMNLVKEQKNFYRMSEWFYEFLSSKVNITGGPARLIFSYAFGKNSPITDNALNAIAYNPNDTIKHKV